ncbi:hypothetical protein D3C81_2305670 [compost metagenome]
MAAAGSDAAQVVDVARAVPGGALGQAVGVADVSLSHIVGSGPTLFRYLLCVTVNWAEASRGAR